MDFCSYSLIHGNQLQYLTFISDLTELLFNINQVLSKLSVTHGDIILTRRSLLDVQIMGQLSKFIDFLPPALAEDVIFSVASVCVSVWVYSGHIRHHYNGIWGTCAPGRRNMHHQGAKCTMVHKGDYVF